MGLFQIPTRRRVLLLLSVITAGIIAGPAARGSVNQEAPEVYEIVTATAVDVLPSSLGTYFQTQHEALAAGMAQWLCKGGNASSADRAGSAHYLMLDVAAKGSDPTARREAARTFPHRRDEAQRLFTRRGVVDGGALVWVLDGHYRALVKAFQAGSGADIFRQSGAVLHFAADAALPFNTTRDRHDEPGANLYGACDGPDCAGWYDRTLRQRFHYGLTRRFRARWEYEVRVWPDRFHRVDDPIEATFAVMIQAHEVADALRAIDAKLTAELTATNPEPFAEISDRYYARLARRAGDRIKARLEAGALLGADLIGSAWFQAGKPPPENFTPFPLDSPPGKSADGPAPSTAFFVGSRHSAVFHRDGCPHAKRIKPDNLVRFDGVWQAREAGRHPCKTCKPTSQTP